jgi:predicted house-cleaning NTP pyrophosphatase (Maf/HAM1 superfamily)
MCSLVSRLYEGGKSTYYVGSFPACGNLTSFVSSTLFAPFMISKVDGCFFAVMGLPMHRVAVAIVDLIERGVL